MTMHKEMNNCNTTVIRKGKRINTKEGLQIRLDKSEIF